MSGKAKRHEPGGRTDLGGRSGSSRVPALRQSCLRLLVALAVLAASASCSEPGNDDLNSGVPSLPPKIVPVQEPRWTDLEYTDVQVYGNGSTEDTWASATITNHNPSYNLNASIELQFFLDDTLVGALTSQVTLPAETSVFTYFYGDEPIVWDRYEFNGLSFRAYRRWP